MKITFDDQIFTTQSRGGASRYFTELITEFGRHPELEVEPVTPFRYAKSEHLIEGSPLKYSKVPLPGFAQRRKLLRTLNSVHRLTRTDVPNIVHHTYYYPEYLRRPATARICTIYDMIPEHYPELFPGGNPHSGKDTYVEVCDALLCISRTTKADVLRHYGTLNKPVVVTPLGVGKRFFSASSIDTKWHPYVLYVGNRAGYKNFGTLLNAFSKISKRQPTIKLLCVGGTQFTQAEIEEIAKLNLRDRIFHLMVTDNELPTLYASANCFVFPSRYEGFGLPILEAFAAGCPVVLAETECFVEVGDSAAQFFHPNDDEALIAIIERTINEPASRKFWSDEGRKRALDFSWYKTAESTRAVYQEISRQYR